MSEWKRAPVDVAGAYWMVSDAQMSGAHPWRPCMAYLGVEDKDDGYWFFLVREAPPRPKNLIEPVAGRWYLIRQHPSVGLEYAQFLPISGEPGGMFLAGDDRFLVKYEIIAEVPSPAEYLESKGKPDG